MHQVTRLHVMWSVPTCYRLIPARGAHGVCAYSSWAAHREMHLQLCRVWVSSIYIQLQLIMGHNEVGCHLGHPPDIGLAVVRKNQGIRNTLSVTQIV